MLTRESTDFSTHLMKYIWYSPKKVNDITYYVAYRKMSLCLWHIDVHVDIFLFMTYKAPLF